MLPAIKPNKAITKNKYPIISSLLLKNVLQKYTKKTKFITLNEKNFILYF